MDSKLSFITTDDERMEGVISYVESAGWHYCFAAFVEEWAGGGLSPPFRLRQPLAIEYYLKIKLGDPKWTRAEIFVSQMPSTGVWDDRVVDGVPDPEFPPLGGDDDEDEPAADTTERITEAERKMLETLRDDLGRRFRWPSSICQFCLGDDGRRLLQPLPNGLRGHADKDFEKVLWRWAAVPSWARSSYLDRNQSQICTLS